MKLVYGDSLEFFVAGVPKPQGSKRPFTQIGLDGKPVTRLVESAGGPLKLWRKRVEVAARNEAAKSGWRTPGGAVRVEVEFWLPRPKSHWGTGRNKGKLKPSAPRLHTTQPDRDKLERAVNDALTTAGVIRDDSANQSGDGWKWYEEAPGKTGALIRITAVSAA